MRNSVVTSQRAVGCHLLMVPVVAFLMVVSVPDPVAIAATPGTTTSSYSVSPKVFGWGFCWPQALAVFGTHLFVANKFGDSVTELNASSGGLVKVISGPSYRFDDPVAITAAAGHLWVVNNASGSVTEINPNSGGPVKVISASELSPPPSGCHHGGGRPPLGGQ